MSTVKTDAITAISTNGDLSLDGLGTGGVSIASTLKMTKGGDISSASPLVIDVDGNYFDVTGTTNFSAMTVEEGNFFMLQFDGALTITHGSGIELPGAANLTTATGDRLMCYATAANTVEVMSVELETAAGGATKEFFVLIASNDTPTNPVYEDSLVNTYANTLIGNGSAIEILFMMPADFTSLTTAEMVCIPDASETLQWDAASTFGAIGQAKDTHSDTITNATVSATANQLIGMDISTGLTGVAANDIVGFQFTHNIDTTPCLFVHIKYT